MEKNAITRTFLMFLALCIIVLAPNIQRVESLLDPDLSDDGTVDIKDVAIAARAFGSHQGHERWNPKADLNQNGEVDISDVLIVVRHMRLVQASIQGLIQPETLTAILRPGESITETKEVTFSCISDFNLGTLKLKASEGYENWLANVNPTEYTDVWTNAEPHVFEITLEVPKTTPPGVYSFRITAYISNRESFEQAYQDVTIEVPPTQVIPEAPLGTILTSALMTAALATYITMPKWRKKLTLTR